MIEMTITNAGRKAITDSIAAGKTAVISRIGVGTGKYTPTESQTALQAEIKRLDITEGGSAGDNAIHVCYQDESTSAYSVYEFGLYLNDGTLFAVYSTTEAILQKTKNGIALLAVDVVLNDISVNQITFGDVSFTSAAATTTNAGVIALATTEETVAGLVGNKAITPAGLSVKIGNAISNLNNAGMLHCNGGYAIANNVDYPEVLSVAFRTDWDFVDISKKFFPVKMGYSSTYGLNFYMHAGDGRLRLFINNTTYVSQAIASYVVSTIRSFLNEGLNSFVLAIAKDVDGNFLPKLYINGNLIENASTVKVPAFAMGSGEFKLNCYTTSSANITTGEVAYQDVCVFNFDMSEESSPYTIADYQIGKSIPPSLKNIVYFGSGKNPDVVSADAIYAWNGNNYILTQPSNSHTTKAVRYKFPLNNGEGINVSFTNLTGGVMVNGAYGKFEFLNNASSIVKTFTIASETLSESWVATDNIVQTRFTFNCTAVDSADARVPTVFENFKITKNGAMLALEDYTITNGTTKMIFDVSGNNNDATITGNVSGDKDINIQRLVDFIKA